MESGKPLALREGGASGAAEVSNLSMHYPETADAVRHTHAAWPDRAGSGQSARWGEERKAERCFCMQVFELIKQGNGNRSQSPTEANQNSSRSHAVLQVRIEQRERGAGVKRAVKTGKLSLIDLAGSERASATANRGARMKEGANINKSLLSLSNWSDPRTVSQPAPNHLLQHTPAGGGLTNTLGGAAASMHFAKTTGTRTYPSVTASSPAC